jgi:hypothetical protein
VPAYLAVAALERNEEPSDRGAPPEPLRAERDLLPTRRPWRPDADPRVDADEAVSPDSRYLYPLDSIERTITGFRVEDDCSLTQIDTEALPPTVSNTIGLAAR